MKLSWKTKLRGMAKEACDGCLADPDGSMDGPPVESPWSVSSLFLSLTLSLLAIFSNQDFTVPDLPAAVLLGNPS